MTLSSMCCHGSLFLCARGFAGSAESTQYIQRARVRSRYQADEYRPFRLGRAVSPPSEFRPDCPWGWTGISPEEVMGDIYRCDDPYDIREARRRRIHPLGCLCDREKVAYRYLKTPYHHVAPPKSILGAYRIFLISTIFSGRWVPHFKMKESSSMGIKSFAFCEISSRMEVS